MSSNKNFHSKSNSSGLSKSSKSSLSEIKETYTQELVVALCGPIGSPIHRVADLLKETLEDVFSYECTIIKLSDFIKEDKNSEPRNEFERIKSLIDKGNELRKSYGLSYLAELAVEKISFDRNKNHAEEDKKTRFESRRICYIIDSIKNQEELNILRQIYREMFYFIGVFSPLEDREKNLKDKNIPQSKIFELIDRDSGEEIDNGQTVRDTFPQADYFLRVSTDVSIKEDLKRFLHIVFKTSIITPSVHEMAMYQATSAASNSACLSRQVGAALTDKEGELLSVGWNDVPRAFGNLYQFSDTDKLGEADKRCINIDGGKCFNDLEKNEIAETIVADLINKEIFNSKKKSEAINIIRDSKIKNLIEFSRAVHAEMHAIILGSQTGGSRVKKGRLYCTTYPCHSCARHIIAAGISEIYYIEPYRKSLAIKLHSDAITENEKDDKKVRILMFSGVAPSRYLQLFGMQPNSRKEDGKKITIKPKTAAPKFDVTLESIPVLEAIVVKRLKEKKDGVKNEQERS